MNMMSSLLLGILAGIILCKLPDRCRLRLARDASTRISYNDHADFNVPTTLAGKSFSSINELQNHIVSIRETGRGDGPRRLSQEEEHLMRSVFEYHPRAARKLKGLQFIQVGPSAKSNDPTQLTFAVMRSEHDGEDISYVSCLRRLAEQAAGREPTERLTPVASILNEDELQLKLGETTHPPGDGVDSLGVRVDLERKQLFIHLASGTISGPWVLQNLRTETGNANLTTVADRPAGEVSIRCWAFL